MRNPQDFYAKRYNVGGVTEERVRRCLETFSRYHAESLLDIGCADGAITAELKKAVGAKEAHGLEIAIGAVEAAKANGIDAVLLNVDTGDFPFPDGRFDAIYCGEVIEHVFNTDHLLDEIGRVLSPEGFCVLSTPNLAGWPNRFALLMGYQPYPTSVAPRHEAAGKFLIKGEEGQWGHIRVFTLRALKQVVQAHGFRVVSVQGCPVTVNTKSWVSRYASLFDRMLSRFPSLANRVILVLKKDATTK